MKDQRTDELIRVTVKMLFATYGYEGVSMRTLSKESGVGLSSIYHFFKDKDVLLAKVYAETNTKLGEARKALARQRTAEEMLRQLIHFQFEHMQDIVYVLKYYLHFRSDFAALPTKTLPPKSVEHVEEVLQKGRETGEYDLTDEQLKAKAKVLAHTINGYLLEYYPDTPEPAELHAIVNDIVTFAHSGLRN